jgi:hypothetical protein
LKADLRVRPDVPGHQRPIIYIQLEDSWDNDDGLRTVAILEHGEFEGFSSVDEDPAAEPFLILHDPMAVAVLPDAKQTRMRRGLRRGRFGFIHGTSP